MIPSFVLETVFFVCLSFGILKISEDMVHSLYLQVRRLEAEGLPSKQAEAITAAMTEVLNDSLENVSLSVVSKFEMQKVSSFFLPSMLPILTLYSQWKLIFCPDRVKWLKNPKCRSSNQKFKALRYFLFSKWNLRTYRF